MGGLIDVRLTKPPRSSSPKPLSCSAGVPISASSPTTTCMVSGNVWWRMGLRW